MQDSNSYETAITNQPDIFASGMELSVRTNKRTGERIAIASSDEQTTIGKLSPSGLREITQITLPTITSKEQRNDFVRELKCLGYTQDRIADIMGISQSTVSNILRKPT